MSRVQLQRLIDAPNHVPAGASVPRQMPAAPGEAARAPPFHDTAYLHVPSRFVPLRHGERLGERGRDRGRALFRKLLNALDSGPQDVAIGLRYVLERAVE